MLIGREKDLEKISDLLKKYKVVHLTGKAGVGKTSVVKKIAENYHEKCIYIGYDNESYNYLLSLADKSVIRRDEIELLSFSDFIEFTLKISEENMLRFLRTLKSSLEENYSLVIIDSADKYRELGAKIIDYLALYSLLKLIVVTDKENLDENLIDVISHLLLEGIATEYELQPLDVNALQLLYPDLDKSFLEYVLKITKGNLNYVKFFAGGYVEGEENILLTIKKKYNEFKENEKNIIHVISLSEYPLTFDDLCDLVEVSKSEILNTLDKLSMLGWISEENNEIKVTSEKIKEFIVKEIREYELMTIHKKLGEHFEMLGIHSAAAMHFEHIDKERSVIHYRTAAFESLYLQDYSLAIMYFKKAWELGKNIVDLYYLAKTYVETGKIKEALGILENVDEDRAHYLLSWIYYYIGNIREALSHALICKNSHSPWIRIAGKNIQSSIFRSLQIYDLSIDLAQEALNDSEKMNFIDGIVYSLYNIGMVKLLRGEKDGLYFLEKAFMIAENRNTRYFTATNYLHYLICYGEEEKALKIIDNLLKECKENNYYFEEKLIMCEYAFYLFKKGNSEIAEKIFKELYKFFIDNNLQLMALQSLVLAGECAIALGKIEEGRKNILEAWKRSLNVANPLLINTIYQSIKKYNIKIE